MIRDYGALVAFLTSRAAAPFEWGPNDCVTFMAAAVEAQTGKTPLADIPVTWTTEEEGEAAIAALGGLEAAMDARLTPIAPAMAQRGDIGGVALPDGRLVLFVVEGDTLAGPDANGVRRVPRALMTKAWGAA